MRSMPQRASAYVPCRSGSSSLAELPGLVVVKLYWRLGSPGGSGDDVWGVALHHEGRRGNSSRRAEGLSVARGLALLAGVHHGVLPGQLERADTALPDLPKRMGVLCHSDLI